MAKFGLILGSGELPWRESWKEHELVDTFFGTPSGPLRTSRFAGHDIVAVARHGIPHRIAPHAVNYRANLRALADQQVCAVIALNTVGGISAEAVAGCLIVPDQIIDYSWGRVQSYHADDEVHHIDFSHPYDPRLRATLLAAGPRAGLRVHDGGTMGVTQGPRLETAAEISRMARDGCSLVGMTGMPEAVLARELGLPFASLALVVNPAAGLAGATIDLDAIGAVSARVMADAASLLERFFEIVEGFDQ